MKNNLLIFISILISGTISSQDYIIDADTLNKGIYRFFEEFKYNAPSLPLDFEIYEVQVKKRLSYLPTIYMLKVNQQFDDSIKSIYGFCDGKDVYIHSYEGKRSSASKSTFVKVQNLGRICSFDDVITSPSSIPTADPGSMNIHTTSSLQKVLGIVDLTNGKRKIVSEFNLSEIIESDSILLNELIKQDEKELDCAKFINKFSERNEKYLEIYDQNIGLIMQNVYYSESDTSLAEFGSRLNKIESNPLLTKIELWQNNYGNGQIKFIGYKAKHKEGVNQDYSYKIGTWMYFFKNGQLKELIDYNIKEQKNGRYCTYDKSGEVIEFKKFKQDIEIK